MDRRIAAYNGPATKRLGASTSMVTSMNPDFWRAMEKLLRLRENEKLDGVEFIQRDGAQYIEVVGHFSFKERIQRGSGPGNKEGTQASRETET